MSIKTDKFRQYGRFSDIERNLRQKQYWRMAMASFTQDQPRETIINLLHYIQNPNGENLIIDENGQVLKFELLQGSGKVQGFADALSCKARVPIGRIEKQHVGFMRRLLEKNYFFQYCRYTIDPEQQICLVFDTPLSLASPYQLYQGLRELALAADMDDDLLTDEFTEIYFLRNGGKSLPPSLVHYKSTCLRHHINALLHELEYGGKSIQRNPGTLAYLILDLSYRLDYMLLPEGFTMRAIDKIHQIFFHREDLNLDRKVDNMLKELRKILERTDEQLSTEFYQTCHTFGQAQEATPELISTFIRSEMPAMQWYRSNNQERAAHSVLGFIVGYLMYQFNLPTPVRYVLHLIYETLHQDFFCWSVDGSKNLDVISAAPENLKEAIAYAKNIDTDIYPGWDFHVDKLTTEDPLSFASSLLEALSTAQLPKTSL